MSMAERKILRCCFIFGSLKCFSYIFLKLKAVVSVGLIIISGGIWCVQSGIAIDIFQNNLKNRECLETLYSS